jgi:Raf kinase inhibitor-like YbhB/YbcL family protein
MSLQRPPAEDPYAKLPELPSFSVTSTDVTDGSRLADVHASDSDVSPQLAWSGFPEGTKSFVVSCYDPDAPTPSGFWHWTVVDLPVTVTELPRDAGSGDDSLPGGAFHVANDIGVSGYSGAAPPEGDHEHRYYFVVHAVGEESLGVDSTATPTVVAFNLAFKALGRAILVGTYSN